MRKLAGSSGYELFESEGRIVLADRGTRGLSVVLFVLGLITFITAMNMTILPLALKGQPAFWPTLASMVGLCAVFGLGLGFAVRAYRRCISVEPHELPVVVAFDPGRGVLDASGVVIAPVAGFRIVTRMQLGSSSPAIWLEHGNGRMRLVAGHPFLGGVGPLMDVFRARGWAA